MGMFDSHNARSCLAICTPFAKVTGPNNQLIYDPISPLWHKARMGLHLPTNINTVEVGADGLEVGDARSQVAARCLAFKPSPTFLFFLDSDVIVPYDALTKLFFRARTHPDYDIFAGVYCLKNPSVPDPLIYTENGQGPFWDWAVGDLLTTEQHGIGSVHMGLTLIRVSLFQRMLDAGIVHGDGTDQNDEPFFCTQNYRDDLPDRSQLKVGTEDIFFCHKARQIGAKIFVDTSVLAGHHDKATGISYGLPWEDGPWKRGKWLTGPDGKRQDEVEAVEKTSCPHCDEHDDTGKGCGAVARSGIAAICDLCKGTGWVSKPLKLALDLGAGSTRREWPGHKTYTTDIRADTKPDYVQDTRLLNLPDNHFDMVASSHHLEHLGRWEQESVWREIYRVCKPGGVIEHVVPNAEWAAEKITAKEIDQHVMNVLYGAQEAHSYARDYNTHYFCYVPEIAVALAQQAGFENVTTESWKDRPELGYNLIIRGTKPLPIAHPVEEPSEIEDVETAVEVNKCLDSVCAGV